MGVLFLLLVAVLHTSPAAPPVQPWVTDFSGRWMVEGGAGGGRPPARGDMGSGWGSPLTMTQDAAKLTVEYVFFGRGDLQPPLKFVYALDGAETVNAVMMGRGLQEQRSRTRWDGTALVITTLFDFTDPATNKVLPAEVRQTLSLDPAGSVLTVETFRAGVLGGPSAATKTVYRKAAIF